MHRPEPRLILPEPPESLKDMSRTLVHRMHDREQAEGFLSFADYMEMALYEPGLGYYSAGLPKLGEHGDFITAPELGSVFAQCLARQVAAVGDALGGPWDILEIGAGSGRLAADLLTTLAQLGIQPERYRILERSADLRAEQARTLESRSVSGPGRALGGLAERVSWLDAPPDSSAGWRGVLIANEVIDALAVERFEIAEDGPRQLGVTFGQDREPSPPAWTDRPAPQALADRMQSLQERLPRALPNGYRSEVCLTLPAWLASVTDGLEAGLALFIDYGYPRAEYYQPARRDGTLVCQMRHRAHFDPFVWPGLQDLSAFVDFTALAEAADQCGLEVSGYAPQSHFLIGCGLEPVLAALMADAAGQTPGAQRARQALSHEIKQLTLPGAMGEKFQVMGLTRGGPLPLAGFDAGSWLDRL
ncbi:MAG: SAM-dependent methyltransferase [Xanthomonadales bacterium]|jgi:SAM-dependent MidA family methyltransferase|nr:SAM-dependent methyltransferase [Xanthomonadales bacterium]